MGDLKLDSPNIAGTSMDRLGIFISALCAAHCFLTPIALALIPAVGIGFLEDEIFHPILAGSVAVIGGFAFSRGYRRHRSRLVLGLAVVGIMILGFAALNTAHHAMTEAVERIATLIGSGLVVSAHYLNWRLLGSSQCDHCNNTPTAG